MEYAADQMIDSNGQKKSNKKKQADKQDNNEVKKQFIDEGNNIWRMSGYEEAMLRMNLQYQGSKFEILLCIQNLQRQKIVFLSFTLYHKYFSLL